MCLFIDKNSPDMPSCNLVQNASFHSRMTLSSWCVCVIQRKIPYIQHASLCCVLRMDGCILCLFLCADTNFCALHEQELVLCDMLPWKGSSLHTLKILF